MFDRIRAAWRTFWNSTAASAPVEQAHPFGVPSHVLASFANISNFDIAPGITFQPAEPFPGTLPDNMALDAALPAGADQIAAYALASVTHEGLGFLGYPYLAELSQRAEYRHVASIWAEHCTRKWIALSGDKEKVAKLEREMKRLEVRALFQEAVEKECFFGRVHIHMDFGDWDQRDEQATPLVLDAVKVNPKRPLKRADLIEPAWCYPGPYSAQNPLAPDFYRPSAWYVSGTTVHASRLLTMVGRPMPNLLKPAYAFGGVSLTQLCKPYIDNWLRARQSVSDLMHSFSVMVLKTDLDQRLPLPINDPGSLGRRLDLFNKTRDNRGTFVVDKDTEDFTNISAPIAGLDKLQAQALEQISSVSGIPLVILLGITPSGLNASSEGEIRTFYDRIKGYQEKVMGPAVESLLKVLQLSLFGEIDEDIGFEFASLWEMSDADKAAIRKSDAEADSTYVNTGAVSPEEVRQRLNDEDGGLYTGRLTGPAPEPEDEDEEDAGSLAFGGGE
jgi:phage-related protein (TIGR01555 family)